MYLEKETSAEFAVIILSSIGEANPKDFAVTLFNYWGIGKKNKDNGLLLLLVMDQRRWEFETGYGLEGLLPDVVLKRIGEEKLVPMLRLGKTGEGIQNVIIEIENRIKINRLEVNVDQETSKKDENNFVNLKNENWVIIYFPYYYSYIFLYCLVFWSLIFYLKSKKKNIVLLYTESIVNWKVLILGSIPFLLELFYTLTFTGYYTIYPLFKPIYLFISYSVFFSFLEFFYTIEKGNYSEAFNHYQKIDIPFRSIEMKIFSLLFPLPTLLFVVWCLFKRRKLRNLPSLCNHCKTPMLRLDEKKDDFFLKEGQQIEEKIGSIDYDVWFCESCESVKIYAYEALFTSYSKCPSCKFKTHFLESDKTTVSPTCSSSGEGVRVYACKNCNYRKKEKYTIPARDCSKSSGSSTSYGSSSYRSSSSSSSSSGSSFGGGRSGGGGAGGSW
ncbi:MAG TPA: TPM domain-containing protein [Leptospiraceae bacterium]|nr:TPM domain-containing protein [Leptospiraceae bacterium]